MDMDVGLGFHDPRYQEVQMNGDEMELFDQALELGWGAPNGPGQAAQFMNSVGLHGGQLGGIQGELEIHDLIYEDELSEDEAGDDSVLLSQLADLLLKTSNLALCRVNFPTIVLSMTFTSLQLLHKIWHTFQSRGKSIPLSVLSFLARSLGKFSLPNFFFNRPFICDLYWSLFLFLVTITGNDYIPLLFIALLIFFLITLLLQIFFCVTVTPKNPKFSIPGHLQFYEVTLKNLSFIHSLISEAPKAAAQPDHKKKCWYFWSSKDSFVQIKCVSCLHVPHAPPRRSCICLPVFFTKAHKFRGIKPLS
ncbi:hypothetical protein ACET3Z_000955 [Daucus carota]